MPGGLTQGTSQPTPVPQPLLPAHNPPAQGNPGVGAFGHSGNPPPGSRGGFQGGRQRNRYRGEGTLVPLMYPLVGMEATKVTTGGSMTQLDA